MKGLLDTGVRVHPVWARVLGVFWAMTTLGVAAVAISSDLIGRPLWWADEERWSTPVLYALGLLFLLPSILSTVLSLMRAPLTHWIAWGTGLELGLLAVVDRDASPGSAVVLAALAGAAILAGIASTSARVRD